MRSVALLAAISDGAVFAARRREWTPQASVVNRIRHSWALPDILGLLPEVEQCHSFVVRCKSTVTGEGPYVKDVGGVVRAVVIVVQLRPGDSFSVSLGHEWPAEANGEQQDELDRAVLRGIIESLARRCSLAALGCGVTTISAVYLEGSGPMAVQVAASMAMQAALEKADWSSPEPPTGPRAA